VPATESLTSVQLFIDGQWTGAARRGVFESDDPYRGKPWARESGQETIKQFNDKETSWHF